MPVCTYSFLGLGQQVTNLTAAPSRLIKGDPFLESDSLVLFPNLAFSNSLTLQPGPVLSQPILPACIQNTGYLAETEFDSGCPCDAQVS